MATGKKLPATYITILLVGIGEDGRGFMVKPEQFTSLWGLYSPHLVRRNADVIPASVQLIGKASKYYIHSSVKVICRYQTDRKNAQNYDSVFVGFQALEGFPVDSNLCYYLDTFPQRGSFYTQHLKQAFVEAIALLQHNQASTSRHHAA